MSDRLNKLLQKLSEEQQVALTKELEKFVKENEAEKEAKKNGKSKIKLSPLSFSNIKNFFLKAHEWFLEQQLKFQTKRLDTLKEEFYAPELSDEETDRVALKIAKLEQKIAVKEIEKANLSKTSYRALKLKEDKEKIIEKQSNDMYVSKGKKKEIPIGISLDEQLERRMNQSGTSVTLNEEIKEEKNKVESVSLEEQLKNRLNANETSKIYPNVDYHLKEKQIIQDELVRPEVAHKDSVNIDDYLNRRPLNEILVNSEEPLQLEPEVKNDVVEENTTVLSNVLEPEVEKDNVELSTDLEQNENFDSLEDMLASVRTEEERAAKLENDVQTAKDDILKASMEKNELEKKRAQQLEEEKQLLEEAKKTILARHQAARERAEESQRQLEQNQSQAADIRSDSQKIAAEISSHEQRLASLREFIKPSSVVAENNMSGILKR